MSEPLPALRSASKQPPYCSGCPTSLNLPGSTYITVPGPLGPPDKPMMFLISSSHEKQTSIKPRASRDREFYISMNRNEESSLPGITSVPTRHHLSSCTGCRAWASLPSAPAPDLDSLSLKSVWASFVLGWNYLNFTL